MEEYIGLKSKIKPFLFLFLVYNLSILGFMRQQMFGFLVLGFFGCFVGWFIGFLLICIQGVILQCKTTNKNMLSFKVLSLYIFNILTLQGLKLNLKYGFRSWFPTVTSLFRCEPEKSSPEEILITHVSRL